MAGQSLNSIKTRLKSVESTRQITKAMELVSTSKLRRAKQRAEGSRGYQEELTKALAKVLGLSEEGTENQYIREREIKKTCYIVIAGDRGLAGGYNSNIFKLADKLRTENDVILPIGKKARDYFTRRKAEMIDVGYETVTSVGSGGATDISSLLCSEYKKGSFDRIAVIYTKFVSMITQRAELQQLLPLNVEKDENGYNDSGFEAICDISKEELIENLVPFCVSGLLYSALCEAEASEHGMRRNAMNSANKNADEIIGDLQLKYNRARQAAITQEITEIVSGAEAL